MAKDEITLIFKLFNSIKSSHEADDFARLEIKGLTGIEPNKVKNFYDILDQKPISIFTKWDFRLQDILTYELPYGETQGYYIKTNKKINIERLVRRLGYTKEIILIMETVTPKKILKNIFPHGKEGKNVKFVLKGRYTLFRFITNQYYLEKSEYISKISRNEEEIKRNLETLLKHPFENLYRVPASSTIKVGRRLEDYFAIREELSLYLTHYMHPYKGKFHPKMVRALLNYICPEEEKKVVLDNFAGSGTLLLEATFMGIDSS